MSKELKKAIKVCKKIYHIRWKDGVDDEALRLVIEAAERATKCVYCGGGILSIKSGAFPPNAALTPKWFKGIKTKDEFTTTVTVQKPNGKLSDIELSRNRLKKE